jgi:hypothetical protein
LQFVKLKQEFLYTSPHIPPKNRSEATEKAAEENIQKIDRSGDSGLHRRHDHIRKVKPELPSPSDFLDV